MIFGAHADIIVKEYNGITNLDIQFTDASIIAPGNNVGYRSGMSNSPEDGIAYLYLLYSNNCGYSYHGARIMYTGDVF